jgi:SAM-dependent methyltransferase
MSECSARPAERSSFYEATLSRLLNERALRQDMRVLVVCGGEADRDVFRELGFDHVTISNVAEAPPDAFRPFVWSVQDVEQLTYDDGSFDLVAVSAGLHHCRSPHRGLLEMYRVAREAVFVLESRDSLLMRGAMRFGVVDEFELTAVAAHGFRAGGVADTSTPNYVYRWTEREVRKTIASYAPHAHHDIRFFHELELPISVLMLRHGRLGEAAGRIAEPVLGLLARVAPSQANLLAFLVRKPVLPRDLQPWMRMERGSPAPDERWIGARVTVVDEEADAP